MGANGILLVAMGMSRVVMNVSFFGVILNIVLNYILIKQLGYGVNGASVSTLVSYVALNIINFFVSLPRKQNSSSDFEIHQARDRCRHYWVEYIRSGKEPATISLDAPRLSYAVYFAIFPKSLVHKEHRK